MSLSLVGEKICETQYYLPNFGEKGREGERQWMMNEDSNSGSASPWSKMQKN